MGSATARFWQRVTVRALYKGATQSLRNAPADDYDERTGQQHGNESIAEAGVESGGYRRRQRRVEEAFGAKRQ